MRYNQYRDALKDDAAFLRRYMTLPFTVPDRNFRKEVGTMKGTRAFTIPTPISEKTEACERRRHGSFGGQTHPADGNAGMVVTTRDKVGELTDKPGIEIRILGFGQARERVAYMPAAPVKAAKRALDAAGLSGRPDRCVQVAQPVRRE